MPMEKLLLRAMFITCIGSIPFIFKKPKLNMWLIVFFSKGVLSSLIDTYVVKKGYIKYPTRPLPKAFDINILYDYLFFPLLSVVWVRMSYNAKPLKMLLQSLYFSVPMSLGQWWFQKRGMLFEWKKWTVLHTFASVNFTLFTIRGLVGLIRRLEPKAVIQNEKNKLENEQLIAELTEGELETPSIYQ